MAVSPVPVGDRWPRRSTLNGLSAAARHDLLRIGTPLQIGAGETLIMEGDDRSPDVYVLVSGLVKIVSNIATGGTVLLNIRADGDLLGELAALDGKPRLATVITVRPCVLRRIGQREFLDFLAAHADAALVVQRVVTGKLRDATWHRVEYADIPVPVRVARALILLAREHGEDCPEGVRIRLGLTQPDLAGLVGARDVTVHRALAGLDQEQVIIRGYREIIIRDLDALHAFAGITEIPAKYGLD